MTGNEKKMAQFVNEINEEADARCERIKKGTDKFIDYELSRVRKAAKVNAKAIAKIEVSKLSEQSNFDSSKARNELVSQIFSKRDEIANRVFDKVKKELEAFTQSEEYSAFLVSSAENIVAALGEETVILIRKEDEKYIPLLSPLCKEVATDVSIITGGCKGVNEARSMRADDTLDARFEQEKKEFYSASGLCVTGG